MARNIQQARFNYNALPDETRGMVENRTELIKLSMRKSVEEIVRIGGYLNEVKGALDHGQFLDWLESEFAWTDRTAQNFMGVAERFKNEIISHLYVAPTVLYLLAAPSTPDEAVQEVLSRATKGERITVEAAKKIVAGRKPKPAPKTPAQPTGDPARDAFTAHAERNGLTDPNLPSWLQGDDSEQSDQSASPEPQPPSAPPELQPAEPSEESALSWVEYYQRVSANHPGEIVFIERADWRNLWTVIGDQAHAVARRLDASVIHVTINGALLPIAAVRFGGDERHEAELQILKDKIGAYHSYVEESRDLPELYRNHPIKAYSLSDAPVRSTTVPGIPIPGVPHQPAPNGSNNAPSAVPHIPAPANAIAIPENPTISQALDVTEKAYAALVAMWTEVEQQQTDPIRKIEAESLKSGINMTLGDIVRKRVPTERKRLQALPRFERLIECSDELSSLRKVQDELPKLKLHYLPADQFLTDLANTARRRHAEIVESKRAAHEAHASEAAA